MTVLMSQNQLGGPSTDAQKITALRAAAIKLEATFLAEMLKSAGVDSMSDSFGGGAGEAQFDSFLIDAQAAEMSRAGGVGLAETLFNSLMKKANAR